MKKLSDALDNEVFNNTKFISLNTTKLKTLEKKIPYATNLIHINEYNTDKQNLEIKIWDIDNKVPDASCLVTTTVLNTNFSEVENKFLGSSKYITTQEFNELTSWFSEQNGFW